MKFAIFVTVVFALATVAQSSVIPVIAVGGPGSIAVQASAVHGPHAAVAVQTIPHIVAVPAAVAVAPVVAGQATYVAQNRGVVHVAPLDGHVQSAVSLNLQAAPGTV
ncbi:adult cuticle protein 1-like [Episyrphus balteatus]|uniref:adult cuticle protein 1-like n=1 Tax=Episyrphus balteatus TaxID=286459 RepID=UPI002486C8E8|nr:adult cuticle protein 1-like [Episyrphus balteatus]